MVKARCIAMTKVVLDLFYIAVVFSVYVTNVFVYMDKFNIGVYGVKKRELYLDSDLYKEIDVNFLDFTQYLCDGSQPSDTKPVCDNKQHFQDAGILYITFTVISHFFALYSVIGMLGIFCKCTNFGVATMQVVHYLYPALHGLSLTLYLTVSRIFNLTTPNGYTTGTYGAKPSVGFILMIIAQIFSIFSMILFAVSRRPLVLFTKIRPSSPKPVLRRRTKSK